MYVDGYILFALYLLSVISLAVSIYAVWTLNEVQDSFNKRVAKEIQKQKTLASKKVSLIYDPWGQKRIGNSNEKI